MMPFKKPLIDQLNTALDAEFVLCFCDAYPIRHDGPNLRAFCPLHYSAFKPYLYVRLEDNTCFCEYSFCKASEQQTLLKLYSLVFGCSLQEAAHFWARKMRKMQSKLFVVAPLSPT